MCLSVWCRLVSDDLLPTSHLLIGMEWAPVARFLCVPYTAKCIRKWPGGQDCTDWLSLQPLIGTTIGELFINSALCELYVLLCQYWHSFYQIAHNPWWWMVVGVNWLTWSQECRMAVFWHSYFSSCTTRSFFPSWWISLSIMSMTALRQLFCYPHTLAFIKQRPWTVISAKVRLG